MACFSKKYLFALTLILICIITIKSSEVGPNYIGSKQTIIALLKSEGAPSVNLIGFTLKSRSSINTRNFGTPKMAYWKFKEQLPLLLISPGRGRFYSKNKETGSELINSIRSYKLFIFKSLTTNYENLHQLPTPNPPQYHTKYEAGRNFNKNSPPAHIHNYHEFLNAILPACINMLSIILGLQVLLITKSNAQKRVHTSIGGTAIFWGVANLLSLYGQPSFLSSNIWNFCTQLSTGLLALLICNAIFSYCRYKITSPKKVILYAWVLAIPCVGHFFLADSEIYIEKYWAPSLGIFYIFLIHLIAKKFIYTKSWFNLLLILYLMLGLLMATHDLAIKNLASAPALKALIMLTHLPEPISLAPLSPLFIVLIIFALIVNKRIERLHLHTRTGDAQNNLTSLGQLNQELHDRLGSRLLSALITIRHSHTKPKQVEEEIESCLNELRLILNNNSESVESLPHSVETVVQKCSIYFDFLKINLSWKISERKKIQVPHSYSLHVKRILNECLTNCLKHADARNVNIQLRIIHQFIVIQVIDDGIGIKIGKNAFESQGIQSMHQRSAAIGGLLFFCRRNPSGLAVRLILKNSSKEAH